MEEKARISLAGRHDSSVHTQRILDGWNSAVVEQFQRHLEGVVAADRRDSVVDLLRTITNGITLSVIEHPDDWPAERQWRVIDDALEAMGLVPTVRQ
jgi:hypothetical protein